MAVMLAADVCRAVLRDRPPALLRRLQHWSAGGEEVVVSALTYAELVAGAMLAKERERHMALVGEFRARLDAVAPWDAAAVEAYTLIQGRALDEGLSLNMNDAMLAAHAMSLGAVLLALQGRGFEKVEGLDLRLWQI